MNYNYYSNEKFATLRTQYGYKFIFPYAYITGYKRPHLKDFLPSILIESDVAFLDWKKLDTPIIKPFYISGKSFTRLSHYNLTMREGGTFILDLKKSIEEIWNNFSYSLQKQIKKAERMNFFVKRIQNETELNAYHTLLIELRTNLGFKTAPYSEIKMVWNALHTNNPDTSCYEAFLCYNDKNKPLAGMGIFINPNEKNFIEVGIGRSQETESLPAGDLLKWEIIKWAKNIKLKSYDLAGVNPHFIKNTKEENIYNYKKKWGGILYPLYHYEQYFPQNKWYYPLIYKLLIWMNFIKK